MNKPSTPVLVGIGVAAAVGTALLVTKKTAVTMAPCPVTTATSSMAAGTGAIPPSGDMVVTGSYVWALSPGGVARRSLGKRGNACAWNLYQVGREGGATSGLIPIKCDCHQGENTFDAADGAGETRVMMDWQPYHQGGPPSSSLFSGLPAQMVKAIATNGLPTFGQQIAFPEAVPVGARLTVVYTGTKFFGYADIENQGVAFADITNGTGSGAWQDAIQP